MKEMIRRDRNHPSIMLWSMGDETSHPTDSKFAVAEDTTRILTVCQVTAGSAGFFVKHTDQNLPTGDISRCIIRGRVAKELNDLKISDGHHNGNDLTKLNLVISSGISETTNTCNWVYEDHGADMEYQNSPLRHVDPSGIVDVYRIPKSEYYLWQAAYSKNLMVSIQPFFWQLQYIGLKEDIIVISNCDNVELFVNGVSKGLQMPDLSNLHCVTFKNILIEKGTISAVGTRNGKTLKTELIMPGAATKVVVTGSQNKIKADRGSLSIITADIVDSRGNHVSGANNSVKWILSGPATLVGPSVYESDIYKNHEMDGVWYMDMPVSNVIRSTGKPGIIHISVSSSGLTSGVLDIEAEGAETANPDIMEPVLGEDGRATVARILINVNRLDEVPREIKLNSDELSLGLSDKSGYIRMIRDYILKSNPSIDTATIEFRTLSDLFSSQLLNSSGQLTANDYNFNVDHFNNCRLISGYVNSTKLPPPFKEGLKKYYSDVIIMKGSEKNAGEEMNWLNWIPSGGTVVVVKNEQTGSVIKGVILTKNSGLSEIISAVYPQFINFSQEAKERALIFVSKMNPYIHAGSSVNQNQEGDKLKQTNTVYTAEEGQPILIPLLKFISE